MVIDPVCAIAFESEPVEPDTMRQPPRDARDSLIGWPQLALAGAEGLLLLAACLAIYAAALVRLDADTARTLAFLAFTGGNLAMIRILGSRKPMLAWLFDTGHATYWLLASLAILVTAACVFVPPLATLFRFRVPGIAEAATAIAIGIGVVALLDLAKRLARVQRVLGGAVAASRRRDATQVPRDLTASARPSCSPPLSR
jgi:Ca2+-transporting ATPase